LGHHRHRHDSCSICSLIIFSPQNSALGLLKKYRSPSTTNVNNALFVLKTHDLEVK
jgi:hypothetical protein